MTGNEPVQEMTRILCIEAMLDPLSKTIQDTAPEFLEHMIDMNSVFEFELFVQLLREYMLFHTIYPLHLTIVILVLSQFLKLENKADF